MLDAQSKQDRLLAMERELYQRQIVEEIERSPLYWLRHHTKTFDEHWKSAGFDSPNNPFPSHHYFDEVFRFLDRDPRICGFHSKVRNIIKSRDLMITWACVGFLTQMAMTEFSKVALQSQNKDKSEELIHYAKVLYDNQEPWLKQRFPLKSGYTINDFPKDRLEFGSGSVLFGIPEGADQIRSFHPTALLMDESDIQPEGKDAYDTAWHACEYIVLLSTPKNGWYTHHILN